MSTEQVTIESLAKRLELLENKHKKRGIVIYDESNEGAFAGCNLSKEFPVFRYVGCGYTPETIPNGIILPKGVYISYLRVLDDKSRCKVFEDRKLINMYKMAAFGLGDPDIIIKPKELITDATYFRYPNALIIGIEKTDDNLYIIHDNGVSADSYYDINVIRATITAMINKHIAKLFNAEPIDEIANLTRLLNKEKEKSANLKKDIKLLEANLVAKTHEFSELRNKLRSVLL